MKPVFLTLWNNFPDHMKYPHLKDLYTWLGGVAQKNIYSPGFGPQGNTCASRMSVALNRAGVPINKSIAASCGARTVSAGDGSQIIYGVADLRKYLLKTLGKPVEDKYSPFDSNFSGKQGIIAFSVNWSNATGHIALWNGASYREPVHDNYSTFIDARNADIKTTLGEFWEIR